MRTILELLRAGAIWFVTGGVGLRPFTIGVLSRPAVDDTRRERRVRPRTAA